MVKNAVNFYTDIVTFLHVNQILWSLTFFRHYFPTQFYAAKKYNQNKNHKEEDVKLPVRVNSKLCMMSSLHIYFSAIKQVAVNLHRTYTINIHS